MTKVTIHNVDGKDVAKATVVFDLGEIKRERVSENGKTISISVGMDVENMEKLYQQIAYDKAVSGDREGFEEAMEAYATYRLYKLIGVKSSPLKYDENGQIQGLDEFVEVEVEEGGF